MTCPTTSSLIKIAISMSEMAMISVLHLKRGVIVSQIVGKMPEAGRATMLIPKSPFEIQANKRHVKWVRHEKKEERREKQKTSSP